MTLLEMQQQINQLQEQLNSLKGEPISTIVPTIIYAEEGKIFKRKHDNFMMGSKLSLGYDYSLGFRRIDKEVFYEQVSDPELQIEE